MNITEIKKQLYLQKPQATFKYIRKGNAYYTALIKLEQLDGIKYNQINFEIPISDMGDADFTPTMDAKLLNRWIMNV